MWSKKKNFYKMYVSYKNNKFENDGKENIWLLSVFKYMLKYLCYFIVKLYYICLFEICNWFVRNILIC